MAPPSAGPIATAAVNAGEIEVIPSQKWLNSKKFSVPGKEFKEYVEKLGRPHIESFNNILNGGLQRAVMNLDPVIFKLPDGREIGLHPKAATIGVPDVEITKGTSRGRVYPSECRQSGDTYDSPLLFTFSYSVDGDESGNITRHMGDVPIMVKSLRCNLHGLTPAELVKIGEEENEIGGYFVVKGHEKLIRMLVATRRNYPLAMVRNGWKSRGDQFSEYGIFIRSVIADDHTATNNVLHYLRDGSAKFMLACRKEMFFVKVMLLLKALCSLSDAGIYEQLMAGREHDTSFSRRVQGMMRELNEGEDKIVTQMDALKLIGCKFRSRVEYSMPPNFTDAAIAQQIMRQCVLPHLKTNEEKFRLLVFMTQKLYAFIANETCAETSDSVFSWEVYLAGDVYLQVLKDALSMVLVGARAALLKKANSSKGLEIVIDEKEILSAIKTASKPGPGMEKFLATGRVNASGNLLMPQMDGLTIVVENISWARYISHFQSIHRGSFFLSMRSTDVRKLTADSWGFICPVHTPDGEPCGLLNHLAKDCEIVTDYIDASKYPEVLASIGMSPVDGVDGRRGAGSLPILLDGNVVGSVSRDTAVKFVRKLRRLKVQDMEISKFTEIGYVPELDAETKDKGVSGYLGGQYPGVFLFTTQNRMMRRVVNLSMMEEELVGSMEQLYLHIAVKPDEIIPGMTTHMEVSATSMMSSLANLIPLPDCNQSPRNMYQCQMAKQTIGIPFHNLKKRPESKLYRLNIPTSPFFRTRDYDNFKMDEYASGTNAIVAVMAYTSYDMEDAMCLNKASRERGLAHATVFKSEIINLRDASMASADSFFQRDPKKPELAQHLDADGLPYPGSRLNPGVPYYCYYTSIGDKYVVAKYKRSEVAFVDTVRVLGPKNPNSSDFRVGITLRVERNPSIGDKFASRAGQKGICSMLWPKEDMPWTESGLVPDIIFNPHGLPSRMTMAKVIEIMAGKAGALHGAVFDATPFEFNEKDTASEYFGSLLEKAGYHRHGTEIMYSGTTGKPFPVEIFMGIVHYQRLRHMVLDKWQVRSRGPMNNITHQPIKGRKRGGGIRVGEMERDAIIGNGCLNLITDRLLDNSDGSKEFVCIRCGSVLSPCSLRKARGRPVCMTCGSADGVTLCKMPYTLKLLCAQLASVNLRVQIDFEQTDTRLK